MLTEATIFRGAFWFSIGAVLERVMYFLLPIFIAPLGAYSLGIFYLSLRIFHSVVSFPAIILNTKYSHKLRLYLENPQSLQFEETAALLLKVYVLAGLIFGILSFTFVIIISPLKSLAFLAVAIPFALLNSYILLLLRLLQRFKKIFIIQAVFIFLFQILYMFIFIRFFKFGIAAAFAGQLLVNILISITACFFIFDRINLLGLFYKINFRLLRISPLPFANALFSIVFPIIDLVLVVLLFNFSTLGQYIVLLYLPLLIHKIPVTIFGMFIHVAAVRTRLKEDITKISKRVFKWILIISMPVFIVIILYPEVLLSLLFHKTYVKDIQITRVIAVSFFLQSISWTAGRILLAKKQGLLYAVSNYIYLFIFILFTLLLTSNFGLFGISFALFIASIFDVLIKYMFVIKHAKVFFIDKEHLKILCTGAIVGFMSFILFHNNPLMCSAFFILFYFAIMYITGIVDKQAFFDFKKMAANEIAAR